MIEDFKQVTEASKGDEPILILGERGVTDAIGHLVLCAVTFGRWKYSGKHDDLAALESCLVWFAIGITINFAFFRQG